ncbi:uncharacterized protein E0L32_006430 [Thyridium curvatum]|uniref:Probable cytosolic iron-sulfur protein assembly protein 1 n=1 Tax=Thyridium curvatum TaxID=1093900 RepID=A0A507B9G3_9PEZI|nr:uncharacterized protein E0L32_006430 [Thyridium curvatum]TPX13230.1 hypothetical protein E0L32_006430 [Thyridium curvatum]
MAAVSRSKPPASLELKSLPAFRPDLYQRAWSSTPHPTLPLLATAHNKAVTIFSLSTLSSHSTLTGGHARSVRSSTWKPGLPPHTLCLVTGSFDSTAALWRWQKDVPFDSSSGDDPSSLEVEVKQGGGGDGGDGGEDDWEFSLVLEGHENEVKSVAFNPSGQYLATCSRDKSVWIWEDVGANEGDDEWETVAVLNEHDGDVKAVAWCPDVPGRNHAGPSGRFSSEVLASASYDNTVRIWREDGDGEWVCVSVLEGHEGTVWGVQFEQRADNAHFPRLMTWSADQTIRIWTLRREPDEEGHGASGAGQAIGAFFGGALAGIPNTMRRSIREEWDCTAILPQGHTRDVYSAAWSAHSGLVASTGSDGVIAVYAEDEASSGEPTAASSSDVRMSDGPSQVPAPDASTDGGAQLPGSTRWRLLATVPKAHGPYEINHITWCKRFDSGTEQKRVEEMLVTTGDDGVVRPWQVVSTQDQS